MPEAKPTCSSGSSSGADHALPGGILLRGFAPFGRAEFVN